MGRRVNNPQGSGERQQRNCFCFVGKEVICHLTKDGKVQGLLVDNMQRSGIKCERINQKQRWLMGEANFEKETRGKYLRRDEEEIEKQNKKSTNIAAKNS